MKITFDIPDELIPDWVRFIAIDADGIIQGYRNRPALGGIGAEAFVWHSPDRKVVSLGCIGVVDDYTRYPDWKTSLRQIVEPIEGGRE